MSSTRAKFGYLSYDDMLLKIESGEVNAYDIIFCKDKHVIYLVSEELVPLEIKSKVYVYDSKEIAETTLNQNTDTYTGQIVSILDGDVYRGYIVNQNDDNSYFVTALYEHPEPIDYNSLNNVPIKNITGSLGYEIILDSLSSGAYNIKGQYKISTTDTTTYLSVSGDFILVDASSSINIFIKRITKDTITDFKVFEGNVIESSSYVTEKFLKDSGYATTDYVNTKVLALEESIKKDIESYVEDIVANKIDSMIDERLETKLDGMIEEIPNEDINNLFI